MSIPLFLMFLNSFWITLWYIAFDDLLVYFALTDQFKNCCGIYQAWIWIEKMNSAFKKWNKTQLIYVLMEGGYIFFIKLFNFL